MSDRIIVVSEHSGTVVHNAVEGKPLCGKPVQPWQTSNETTYNVTCERCLAEIRVEVLKSSQSRRYGPTVHEYLITDLREERRTAEQMMEIAQGVRLSYLFAEMPHPFADRLRELTEVTTGVWSYRMEAEYSG